MADAASGKAHALPSTARPTTGSCGLLLSDVRDPTRSQCAVSRVQFDSEPVTTVTDGRGSDGPGPEERIEHDAGPTRREAFAPAKLADLPHAPSSLVGMHREGPHQTAPGAVALNTDSLRAGREQ